MAEISVEEISAGDRTRTFTVSVLENGASSRYTVELDGGYYERLTDGEVSAQVLVEKSFEFLLEREPAKSILNRFNLSVIERYFPEYPEEIGKYF